MNRWLTAAILLPFVSARADTVMLKNGAWIDGMVTLKTDSYIQLQIGNIGKIELPVEDIHSIEKNNRTGKESPSSYLEPKGPTEKLGSKPKAGSEKEKKDGDSKSASKKDQSEKASGAAEKPGAVKDPGSREGDGEEGSGERSDAKAKDGEEGLSSEKKEIDPELKKRIEDLVADIQRQRPRNRIQAERHLEAIGPPAIPFLIPLAQNENELVRIAVMKLFSSFGDHQVIEASIQALLDENEYVRDYANKALKKITGEDFGFSPGSFPKRREIAHEKWVKWWEKEKAALEEDRKLSQSIR